MSDLFTPLRTPDREGPAPVPAEEVRRRGDRLRRRRVLIQVGASAAAVAAVLVGAGLVVGQPGASGPAVTRPGEPRPTASALPLPTQIPADFPLATGLPAGGGRLAGMSADPLADLSICPSGGVPGSVTRGRVDTEVVQRVRPDSGAWRTLGLYADRAAASRAARDLASAYDACPRFSLDDGKSDTVTTVTPQDEDPIGEEAWTIERGFEAPGSPGGGEQVTLVVRVANAVLIGWSSGEGPGLSDRQAMSRHASVLVEQLRPTVQALCELTGGPCRGPAERPPLTPSGTGAVRLGMTADQVAATGATVERTASSEGACRLVALPDSPPGAVDGMLSDDRGLAVLFAPTGMRTPEGIGIGSTAREARDAFPRLTRTPSGWRVPVGGGAHYVIGVEDGVVTQLGLQLDDQDCVG